MEKTFFFYGKACNKKLISKIGKYVQFNIMCIVHVINSTENIWNKLKYKIYLGQNRVDTVVVLQGISRKGFGRCRISCLCADGIDR